MSDFLYLDWAATTPLCEEAELAMAPYMRAEGNVEYGSNANSLHTVGRHAFAAMEEARRVIAGAIGARSDELIFTSGATESDNMAVFGMLRAECARREQAGRSVKEPHIITGGIEHPAIMAPTHWLRTHGCRITRLSVDKQGRIDEQELRDALCDDTVLVSIMLANNEVGVVEDIKRLCEIAHEAGVLFHTDATQALGKMPIDCHALGVDAASFSAHKVCGPKGIGALYLAKGVGCDAFLMGGGQESGRRSGTQNVAGMVGFAAAVAAHCAPSDALTQEIERQRALRDALYAGLCAHDCVIPSVNCKAGSTEYLPNIVSVCVDGLESQTIILRMDMKGVEIAGGSACSSASLDPSKILLSLGIDRDLAFGAVRFSLGYKTTQDDIERALRAFDAALAWE